MATKYEMRFRGPRGTTIFLHLGWSERKTKGALLEAMRVNGPAILKLADIPENDKGFTWSTRTQAWTWKGFQVDFSGNTKPR